MRTAQLGPFNLHRPHSLHFGLFLLIWLAAAHSQAQSVGVPKQPLGEGPWIFDTAEQHKIRVSVISSELEQPWSMAWLPNGDMLVTERPGRLRLLQNGTLNPEPIEGLPEIRIEGNGGLQDVAVHPNFADNQLVYFTYTKPVENGWGAPSLAVGQLADGELVDVRDLIVTDAYEGNSGLNGRVAFGSDGYIYFSTGGRIDNVAQDLMSLRGKVLRIEDDGSIPFDNPFLNRRARPEIYTYGHRNTLGLAIHPITGDMWQHENGPNGGDEVNILSPGSNYGWPEVSFGRFYSGGRVNEHPTREGIASPLLVWLPAVAASGLAIYGGDQFPAWKGNLLVGSLRMGGIPGTGHLQRIVFNERTEEIRRELMLMELKQRIREVREGPDGLLYLLTGEDDGALLLVEPAP